MYASMDRMRLQLSNRKSRKKNKEIRTERPTIGEKYESLIYQDISGYITDISGYVFLILSVELCAHHFNLSSGIPGTICLIHKYLC